MNIKIIGKCIKSTKPMLKPEQVGNSKAFIVNDEKEEYEEYDVEEVINSLKDYLSKQQYNYSIHLIKNWKDTNVLHKLMSITQMCIRDSLFPVQVWIPAKTLVKK